METKSDVIALGSLVEFGDEDVGLFQGKITGITIRKYTITYEVTFWKEHEQKTIWLYEEELRVLSGYKRMSIGFK